MRRPSRRRSLRGLALAVVAALALLAAAGCGPTQRGIATAKAIARQQLRARGWISQGPCLESLWQHESGWNVYAYNKASGAYGIPQALPAKRMAWAGRDWATNPSTQIRWGLHYIAVRYGGPCNAWHYWRRVHWYDKTAPEAGSTLAGSSSS